VTLNDEVGIIISSGTVAGSSPSDIAASVLVYVAEKIRQEAEREYIDYLPVEEYVGWKDASYWIEGRLSDDGFVEPKS
jgi:hypothetical protein